MNGRRSVAIKYQNATFQLRWEEMPGFLTLMTTKSLTKALLFRAQAGCEGATLSSTRFTASSPSMITC